jgi:hypothetical protein
LIFNNPYYCISSGIKNHCIRCKRNIIFLANSRRNINDDQRTYLIGKRYKEEKKEHGGYRDSSGQNDHLKTSDRIAEQNKVSHATVERAEKFAEAVDTVAENTGINPQKILSDEINSTRKDIQDVSKMEPAIQKTVFFMRNRVNH